MDASLIEASSSSSIRLGQRAFLSQRSKKAPASYPGAGQYKQIYQDHQNAALNEKEEVIAETAEQVAGRPGAMPYTLTNSPFPASAKDKDSSHNSHGSHHKAAQQLHAKLTTAFIQDAARSMKSKKAPCSLPGCGQYKEIYQDHQNAALNEKEKVIAETAEQVAGRPGAMPYTLSNSPFPASAKDKGHGHLHLHAKERH